MTAATPAMAGAGEAPRAASATLPILPVLGVALAGVLVISLPNLADPMIRHDDYPALFAEPSWFWNKTLHEGRWVNYLWHLRAVVTPAWLNFAVYQILWAVLAAALGVAARGQIRGRSEGRWFAGVLALFILVAPPATAIALWFNTLIPGLALVALYAVLGCRMSQRWHRALLLPFTVATFMAYTTYPLILLAVCLLRTERRSLPDLAGLLALFAASFAAAVLVTYALNWQVHGVFGVPLADWRHANPASDLAGLIGNLPVLDLTVRSMLAALSFDFRPLIVGHLTLLLIATIHLARLAPKEALYLHAGLWTGMALIAVQVLKLGVQVPPRSFAFAWILYGAIVVRAAALHGRAPGWPGRIGRTLPLLIVIGYVFLTFHRFTTFHAWQSETRDLARAVSQTEGAVILHGDVMDLSSAGRAGLQDELALVFRIKHLTGRRIVLCHETPGVCATLESDAAQTGLPPPFRVDIAQSSGETRLTYSAP